jgi:hypothetical protein
MTPAAAPAATIDPNAEERRNVRNLLRWIGGFLAWPGLTIALAFLLDLDGHEGHFVLSLGAGLAGVALFWRAAHIAGRFYPTQ